MKSGTQASRYRRAQPRPVVSRWLLSALLLLMSTLLVACGGGGGGGSSDSGSVSTTSVGGTVSKGPVDGASIALYRAGADGGPVGDPVATGITTNADGTWSGAVPQGLPRPLVVIATGGSYTDEATGNPVDLDGRSLRSYLPEGADSVAVTPLTELLVQVTQEQIAAGTDVSIDDALADARAVLSTALGVSFDPLTTQPLAMADAGDGDRDQRAYTAILAGLSELANDLAPTADSFAVVQALIEDMSDGIVDGEKGGEPITIGDSVDTLPNTITPTNLVNAINSSIAGDPTFDDVAVSTDVDGNVVVSPLFSLGGTVTGLNGTGLVLQNNAGNDLSISDNGSFTFNGFLAEGVSYNVSVLTQPTGLSQTCAVTDGAGTLATDDVTSVSIACTTNTFTVGGSITDLTEDGLILRNNGGDELTRNNGETSFTFTTEITDGEAYDVTIATQAGDLICAIANASGNISGSNIASVDVDCGLVSTNITGNGTISTPTGQVADGTLALLISAEPGYALLEGSVSVTGAGCTGLLEGNTYTVTLGSEACTVTAEFEESTITHTVSVVVSGLSGSGLVLQNNAGDDLAIPNNGSFSFATEVADSGAYAVTVLNQPGTPQQLCLLDGTASGTATGPVSLDLTCGLAYHSLLADWGVAANIGRGTLESGFTDGPVMADTTHNELVMTDACEVFMYFDSLIPAANSTVGADHGCFAESERYATTFSPSNIEASFPETIDGGLTELAWTLSMDSIGSAGITDGLPDAVMGLGIPRKQSADSESVRLTQGFLARMSDNASIADITGDWGIVRLELVKVEPSELNYSVLSFGATIDATAGGTFASLGFETEADLQQFVDGNPVTKSGFFGQRTDELFDLPISVSAQGDVSLVGADLDGFMDPDGNLLVLARSTPSLADVRADTVPLGAGETEAEHELLIGVRRGTAADLNGKTYRLVGPSFFINNSDFEISTWTAGGTNTYSFGASTVDITLDDTWWYVPFGNAGDAGVTQETEGGFTLPTLPYSVGTGNKAGLIEIDLSDVLGTDEGYLTGYVQAGGRLLVLGLGTTETDEFDVMDGGVSLIFGICTNCD